MLHDRMTDALAAGADAAPPPWLNKRFDAAGNALPEPGCTVVAHITDPATRAALQGVRARLAAEGLDRFWAWVPEASWHMTLFDLVLHGAADPARDPQGLPSGLSPRQVEDALFDRLRGLDLGDAPPWEVAPRGIYRASGIGVALTGADAREERRLRFLRDRIAEATGLSARPGHAEYRFHITLGYQIAWPTAPEAARADAAIDAAADALAQAAPRIPLGAPEACRFADMTAYPREFFLG